MNSSARTLLTVAVAAVGVLVPLAPANAACTTQLVSAPAGRTSSCTTYSHGWAVVGITGVTEYTVTCGTYSRSGTVGTAPAEGSFPTGGCTATMTLRAVTSGTTAVGYM